MQQLMEDDQTFLNSTTYSRIFQEHLSEIEEQYVQHDEEKQLTRICPGFGREKIFIIKFDDDEKEAMFEPSELSIHEYLKILGTYIWVQTFVRQENLIAMLEFKKFHNNIGMHQMVLSKYDNSGKSMLEVFGKILYCNDIQIESNKIKNYPKHIIVDVMIPYGWTIRVEENFDDTLYHYFDPSGIENYTISIDWVTLRASIYFDMKIISGKMKQKKRLLGPSYADKNIEKIRPWI
jgi:hypothetical protein